MGIWCVTVLTCLFLGVQAGMMTAVSLSLLLFIANSASVQIHVLGRLRGSVAYRPVAKGAKMFYTSGVTVINFEAPIWFANVGHLKREMVRHGKVAKVLVIDMSCVAFVDSTGIFVFLDTAKTLKEQFGCDVLPCALTPEVEAALGAAGAASKLSLVGSAFPVGVHDAVERGRDVIQEQAVDATDV